MNERIHILITGEHGQTIKLRLKRQKLCILALLTTITLIVLTLTSLCSVSLFTHSRLVTAEISDLRIKARNDDRRIARLQQQAATEREEYTLEIEELSRQNEQLLAEHQLDAADERNRLKAEIARLKSKNAQLLTAFEREKDQLLSTAVSELYERSELIDTMMRKIGVKVSASTVENNANSGGPFVALEPGIKGELLERTDSYIKAIKAIPLGRPVNTAITSTFGPRKDPLNKKRGFHEGIDFRGKTGDKIYATADGVVRKATRNGSYGNYVEIDHKNGYRTSFAHLKKYVVANGDTIKRGQLIGYVGNTGRSTGPHLHYEVLYKGKPVDPMKFMQVAKLLKEK